jgi:hypothetical protein
MVHVLHIHQVDVVLITGIALGVLIPVFFYNYLVNDGGPLWFLFYFRKSRTSTKPAPTRHEAPQHA